MSQGNSLPSIHTDPLFGSHLQFSCPRLTTWGSLSGGMADLNNVLENLEAKRLDLKQRYKFTSARSITNLFNYYHVFIRSQPVEVEPRIKNASFSMHTWSLQYSPGHYLLHQKTRQCPHTPLSLPSGSSSSVDASVSLFLLNRMLVGSAFSLGSCQGLLSWLIPASAERRDSCDISYVSYTAVSQDR